MYTWPSSWEEAWRRQAIREPGTHLALQLSCLSKALECRRRVEPPRQAVSSCRIDVGSVEEQRQPQKLILRQLLLRQGRLAAAQDAPDRPLKGQGRLDADRPLASQPAVRIGIAGSEAFPMRGPHPYADVRDGAPWPRKSGGGSGSDSAEEQEHGDPVHPAFGELAALTRILGRIARAAEGVGHAFVSQHVRDCLEGRMPGQSEAERKIYARPLWAPLWRPRPDNLALDSVPRKIRFGRSEGKTESRASCFDIFAVG